MDSYDDDSKKGFLSHMTHFSTKDKLELMNLVQYALLAVIPVMLLNRLIQQFIPEADDTKGNLELSLEIIIQIVLIFVAIVFIHRLICYVPTYSGRELSEVSLLTMVLPFLIIVLSLQTKLGTKLEIIADRIMDMIFGSRGEVYVAEQGGNGQTAPPQRPSIGSTPLGPPAVHQPSMSDNMNQNQPASLQPAISTQSTERTTSYGSQTPAQGSMGQDMSVGMNFDAMHEPMAANGALGGAFGGSAW